MTDTLDLTHASEIFDGITWYRGLVPGSIKVDQDRKRVSFVVQWRGTTRRSRITLALDQVKGVREEIAR
jgi:hypothetical protein